ncbi:MAG: SRPBCC family protein [Hyphomicrobium sp.]|nr:SRPBCC family protein [Hyphomicrobium sp.]
MDDRIEKHIELKAPVARVWRALTDHNEFGTWFRARLDSPFETGKSTRGPCTYPGYEHVQFEIVVTKLEPERVFAFTWGPYAVDPKDDSFNDPPTTVEFTLEASAGGTRLHMIETGYEKFPSDRRRVVFRDNEGGWTIQMENIARYVEHAS